MEKVVWIIGSSFSGSSLLNLLLDTQPGIRGLGEGSQVYWQNPNPEAALKRLAGGPCARCKSTIAGCALYAGYHGEPFYAFNFEHYGCRVVVDSSKSVDMFLAKPHEPQFEYHGILLSKAPHEAAYSWRKHAEWDHWNPRGQALADVDAALDNYLRSNRYFLSMLPELPLQGNAARISYGSLAENPTATIRDLCHSLDEPFSTERLEGDWWQTDTHVLGGNPALVAQITQDDRFSFAVPPDRYLDGKYHDKRARIFRDEAWKGDPAFARDCQRAMLDRRTELAPLVLELGHDFDRILYDLQEAAAAPA